MNSKPYRVTAQPQHRMLVVGLGIAAFAVTMLLGYLIWSGYQEAIRTAENITRDYAELLEGRLDATLRDADKDLLIVASTIPIAALSKSAVPRYAREWNAKFDLLLLNFPELFNLRVFDADGDLLYTNNRQNEPRIDISDRPHFRKTRESTGDGSVISDVIVGRTKGEKLLIVSRPLRDANGAFRGIVTASIKLNRFLTLFQSLKIGPKGIIAFFRSDNFSLVLRWPVADDKINVPLPADSPTRSALANGNKATTSEIVSTVDGTARIYSERVLDRYPFFVAVGAAKEDALATWRVRSITVALCGLTLLALLLGMLNRLWRSEQALRANEELMRSTFEQAAVGIAHIEPATFHILIANNRYCNLLGYTKDELIGTDSRNLRPAEDMQRREAERAQLIDGTVDASSREIRLIRKDGKLLWANRDLSLVRDAHGKPQYFISVIEDTSARKAAELAMAREHTRLQTILRTASDGIHILDGDGLLIEANDAFLNMLGYDRSAIGRLHVADWDIQDKWSVIRDRDNGLIDRKEAIVFATRHKRSDGRILDIEISACGIEIEGRGFIYAASRDISERAQAAAKFRLAASVFETAAEGISITDRDNNIISVNSAFTEITGYAADEVIGKNPRILSSGVQTRGFFEAMWASIEATGRWQGEIWNRRKNGELICELLSISVVYNEHGEVNHYCGVFMNISERKAAETKLAQLNAELELRVAQRTAELEAVNRELSAFSYTVAHDLRAPLRAVNGFSEMVLKANEGKLDQASVGYLKRVVSRSRNMSELIDDLLNLAQLTRQEMRRESFDLSELAAGVIASMADAHPEREVTVGIQPDMGINGDRGLMRAVLDNLIGNAWKFTAKTAAAKIEVGFGRRGGQSAYFVRDNGAGFDMQYAHKIFSPFQRLHQASEFEGTGIGLATVKKIIERHGGNIWIESAVNAGTTVFFTIGNEHGSAGHVVSPVEQKIY